MSFVNLKKASIYSADKLLDWSVNELFYRTYHNFSVTKSSIDFSAHHKIAKSVGGCFYLWLKNRHLFIRALYKYDTFKWSVQLIYNWVIHIPGESKRFGIPTSMLITFEIIELDKFKRHHKKLYFMLKTYLKTDIISWVTVTKFYFL